MDRVRDHRWAGEATAPRLSGGLGPDAGARPPRPARLGGRGASIEAGTRVESGSRCPRAVSSDDHQREPYAGDPDSGTRIGVGGRARRPKLSVSGWASVERVRREAARRRGSGAAAIFLRRPASRPARVAGGLGRLPGGPSRRARSFGSAGGAPDRPDRSDFSTQTRRSARLAFADVTGQARGAARRPRCGADVCRGAATVRIPESGRGCQHRGSTAGDQCRDRCGHGGTVSMGAGRARAPRYSYRWTRRRGCLRGKAGRRRAVVGRRVFSDERSAPSATR